ncbi:MAG: PilZ domain-containing protein [Polyangiaceae bacterium]
MALLQRGEARVDIRLPVVLYRRRREVDAETLDVSSSGLFVRTTEAVALRSLVRVKIEVGGYGPMVVHAMVVHVIEPSDGEADPGLGLQFWGLGGRERAAWNGFVASVSRQRRGIEQSGPIPKAALSPDGPAQRRVQTK